MEYYYKTSKGKIFEIDNVQVLDLSNEDVVELSISNRVKVLNVYNNKITQIHIPKDTKIRSINLNVNNLSSFIIPESCTEIFIGNNKLTELILPKMLEYVSCSNNLIKKLDIPYGCETVNCSNNELTDLVIGGGVTEVNCTNNKLTQLTVPDSCIKLHCKGNNIKKLLVTKDCQVFADDSVIIEYKKQELPTFGKTDKVISDLVLKIKNTTLWSIADQLTKELPDQKLKDKIDIKTIKKLAANNQTLGQVLNKKEGQELIKANSSGFSIADIQAADFFDGEQLCQNKFIEIGHTKWDGAQIIFKDKPNYVFQINLKPFKNKEILANAPNLHYLNTYIKTANHPTSKSTLTLARIRYTYLEDKNAILLDEIQTDLDDNDYLGKELMIGREEFTMKLFIQYVRKQYKIRKIYMPTHDTKIRFYDANPPMYLYKELPNKFGFKKTSDFNGFMVLEKFELPKLEDYNLIKMLL